MRAAKLPVGTDLLVALATASGFFSISVYVGAITEEGEKRIVKAGIDLILSHLHSHSCPFHRLSMEPTQCCLDIQPSIEALGVTTESDGLDTCLAFHNVEFVQW